MNKQNLNSQIEALLESIDNQENIAQATQLLHKRFFEKALNAELDQHLGYEKHQPRNGNNSRNGTSTKTLMAALSLKLLRKDKRECQLSIRKSLSYILKILAQER